MRIKLSGGGKRFNREWIFRHARLELSSGHAYAITGHNGSGKSTLLQCIGGMMALSEGRIEYEGYTGKVRGEKKEAALKKSTSDISAENIYNQVSFVAPYMEVPEELTLTELLQFHSGFKSFIHSLSPKEVIHILGLQGAAGKQIRYYSSGMKQRVKLALALFFDAGLILLDEPCSNLDAAGIELYHHLVQTYAKDRLVIVCSNDEVEYSFCNEVILMNRFKHLEVV